jgi:UDP-N-acetylmuramate: L-alanyl-gamma-D-glutamyl-meso-diaminopimelate ligase
MVIEGDEYDTAFFDKGPKFLHYDPKVAILTSVEFDHADIFRDLAHIEEAFDRLIGRMSPASTLIPFDGDKTVAKLIQGRRCRVVPYGHRPESPWRLGRTEAAPPWTRFEVLRDGRPFENFRTRLMGRHNLGNILACIAAADSIGIAPTAMAAALESFQGPRRRQEIRGVKRGVTVIDDFAHHPTAVRETLLAIRSFYPGERLVAVFEPRTNTSMRRVFQEVYPRVFADADRVLIRKPSRLDKIPPDERFSSEALVDDLKRRGMDAHHFDDTDAIIRSLAETSQAGDVILIMSNGGFDNIHERLLAAL